MTNFYVNAEVNGRRGALVLALRTIHSPLRRSKLRGYIAHHFAMMSAYIATDASNLLT